MVCCCGFMNKSFYKTKSPCSATAGWYVLLNPNAPCPALFQVIGACACPEPKASCHIPSAVPQPMGCPFAWLSARPGMPAATGALLLPAHQGAPWWVRLLTLAWTITNPLPPERGDASREAVLAVRCHVAFVDIQSFSS